MEVELNDGESLTGFITGQDEQLVTLATKERLHRIPREQIADIRPQNLSLMPEGLTSSLSKDELRDLMKYLGSLGAE